MLVLYYSEETGRVRRMVREDTSPLAHILAMHPAGRGEASIVMPGDAMPAVEDAQAYVTLQTGKHPSGDRYAVVQGTEVVGVILADPTVDSIPGRRLIASADAKIGDRKLADDTFVPPATELDRRIARLQQQRLDLVAVIDPPLTEAELIERRALIDSEIAALNADKART